MLTTPPRSGQKLRKYKDCLILCYASLVADEIAPFWRYGYEIYLLKPERRRSINPTLEDCDSPCVHALFGFVSDKFAIRAAQKYLEGNHG